MIIGDFEDEANLISMAMNGWGAPEAAWWLNLQANPEAVVELAGGIRPEVLGRAAVGVGSRAEPGVHRPSSRSGDGVHRPLADRGPDTSGAGSGRSPGSADLRAVDRAPRGAGPEDRGDGRGMECGRHVELRKVLAIQEHFHNGDFAYSTDVETGDDVDSLIAFLTRTKVGFSQHYTAAMTAMVRELGLPARVAVGFRSGTWQDGGGYLVRTGDAYSWVEVLFPGYGWLQFEPEPGPAPHPNAKPGTYLNPAASTDAS